MHRNDRHPCPSWVLKKSASTVLVFVALLGWLIAVPAAAEPSHALAMHGVPKYQPDFVSFDYANAAAPQGGTITYAAIGSFDSLNPWVVQGQAAAGVRPLMYETLMKRSWDEAFTLYGLLAETVDVPADRSWVTFRLNPNAKFSDGKPVTADDVVFSWNLIRTEGRPNSRTTYNKITSVDILDERSVRFNFADGNDRELPLLVAGFLPILSKDFWSDRNFPATSLEPPVSSGPYLVEAVDPGRSITFVRNRDYWGSDLPVNAGHFNIERIHYDYYRDGDIAVEAFKAGDYDFRYEFDAARWATQYDFPAASRGDVELETVPHGMPSGLRAFAFNLRKPIFSDRRIRRAFVHAFDFERINRVLLHSAFVRTSSIFDNSEIRPPSYPSNAEMRLLAPLVDDVPLEVFGPSWSPPVTDGSGDDRRNLRIAQELLRDVGWRVTEGKLFDAANNPVRVEILLVSPSDEGLALAYAENLERLGVEVVVSLVESAQYQARLEEFDFDIVIARWGVTLSPGNEQQNYWSSATANAPGSRNIAGVSDPAVDVLIEALVAARYRSQLVAAARALDRVLMWNNYVIPLYHQPGYNMAKWHRVELPDVISTYGPVQETFWLAE